MATLYIEKGGTEITVEDGTVVLRQAEKIMQKLPLNLVERIVGCGDLTVSGTTARRLAAAGIGLYWPADRLGAHALVWPGDARGGVRKLGQAKLYWDAHARREWANRAVRGKLQGQMKVLRSLQACRPDKRFELQKGIGVLAAGIGRLRSQPLEIQSILGVEGGAAASYFTALGSVFAPGLQFHGRNRRPPKDPVNAVLSLGYTLLYHAALEAILGAGLEPSYGFLHEPTSGRASLACDLMEPFRPEVDWRIWLMWQDKTLRAESFSINQGACLLGKAGRKSFYAAFEAPLDLTRIALRKVCVHFARVAEKFGALDEGITAGLVVSEWKEDER